MAAPQPPEPPPAEPGALDEARIAVYTRLLDAQDAIAQARYRRGVSDEAVQAALDASDEGPTPAERREDLYLSALIPYVDALGGRLEIHAVFGDETVVLTPGTPAAADRPRPGGDGESAPADQRGGRR